MNTFRQHRPEYLIEATLLGLFMLSACGFTILFEHPAAPGYRAIGDPFVRRALIGLAMGATAMCLIYSPIGRRSGAHFNPSVTLTYFLVLTQYLRSKGRPFPADSRSNDRWFQHIKIVASDMDRAYARLRENDVEYASSAPQTLPAWNKTAAGIRAFYFRDPDEHYLELIEFPAGKGDPRWQRSDGRLFLGIDHSAIVVSDTANSVAFYGDLGFHVSGKSENYGDEQEHLNNVFGAHLRISSMRAESGPGIELLEYLAPRDGRAMPADVRANDIVFWEVVIDARSAAVLQRPGAPFVVTPRREFGFERAAIVRDPDGYAMELIEQ